MKNNYVSYNGFLKVKETKIVNQYNEIIKLKGISTHGIQWYGKFVNKSTLTYLKKNFKINALRIAMYTEENGYIYNKNLINQVHNIIKICQNFDLYIIIDWHILKDGNPNTHILEAIEFFDKMSQQYKDCANILYEICNEPNGHVSWEKDIKPYAIKVIETIRKNSPKSIIIVGTEKYSQRIDIPADNPLDYTNILYSLHFYSGTHKEELRNKLIYALKKKLPVIVSEFGVCDAQTNGILDLKEAKKWLNLLKKKDISIFNWALSDKKEASSILINGSKEENINDMNLTNAGRFIKEIYQDY